MACWTPLPHDPPIFQWRWLDSAPAGCDAATDRRPCRSARECSPSSPIASKSTWRIWLPAWSLEFTRAGRTELVWDARASTHTAGWFNGIEELNDYVVYVADPSASGWTRQCCRQADVILLLAPAGAAVKPWPTGLAEEAVARGARVELALLHDQRIEAGAATRWLQSSPATLHHHVVDSADLGRLARLLTRRGVGLVLSGGGARGFAHLGVIQALREARVPIDFVGGSSIGSIIAAGVAVGWSDDEMRMRYRRSFVDTNPVNDYTFPFIALTRGRKVSRLLRREYGDVLIEDLGRPYFCVSANLTTGRALEHRDGSLADALRASVAIPGVMPPVYRGEDVLVDGAAINNLPVDIMQGHAPGLVIGSDVGADRFALGRHGRRRINIFQILMHSGMVNSASSAAMQRELADVLLKPPLENVDLLIGAPSIARFRRDTIMHGWRSNRCPPYRVWPPPRPTARSATPWPRNRKGAWPLPFEPRLLQDAALLRAVLLKTRGSASAGAGASGQEAPLQASGRFRTRGFGRDRRPTRVPPGCTARHSADSG